MIEEFKKRFSYRNGKLYWKPGHRLEAKEAGYKNKNGYIQIRITLSDGIHPSFLAHRIIFALQFGYLPDVIDHIDRNPQNNSINNLRDASKALNTINSGIPNNNTSGIKGVSWHKNSNKWSAQIKVNQKKIHLGIFKTIENATIARNNAENYYWSNIT